MLTLTSPWLLLLLLLLPLLPWLKRRHPRRLPPLHHRLLLGVRGAVLLLLVVALAQPIWHARRQPVSVLFAVDVSRSISPAFLDASLSWVETLAEERRSQVTALVGFADHAERAATPSGLRTLPVLSSGSRGDGSALDRGASDLESAIRQALPLFPEATSRRLVLLSDGRETSGDVSRIVERSRRAQVRIFTLPAETRHPARDWIEEVRPPAPRVEAGAPLALVVELASYEGGTRILELATGTTVRTRRALELEPGRTEVPLQVELTEPGLVGLEIRLLDGESDILVDLRRLPVTVASPPRLLLVESADGEGVAAAAADRGHLAAVLAAAGFEVDRRFAVGGGVPPLPAEAAALADYDALLLNNLSPGSWQEQQMAAIAEFVSNGGGLVFITGAAAYGRDGYSQTRLEEILPVRFEIPEERQEVALVIALDKSYSMEGRKIELAREAARAVVDVLDAEHEFGLVAFDWNPYVIVPLQAAADRDAIKRMIGRVEASAQTNFFPALETAVSLLESSTARTRHIILLSDGKTYPDEYDRLLADIRAADITASTVAVGAEADRELLADIARWGGGRSYYLADAGGVERILIDETQITVQDTLQETPFRPTVAAPLAATTGLDFAAAPPLLGYAITRARETAEPVLLTDEGDPLLIQWHYGLGKALVFTSDAGPRWAAEWLSWGGFGKFWAQVVRQALAANGSEETAFTVSRHDRQARVELTALSRRGGFRDGLEASVRVQAPSGSTALHPLVQEGPGTYGAELELEPDPRGLYRFELAAARLPAHEAGLDYPAADEDRPGPPDLELLGRLASATGGKLSPSVEEIFAPDEAVATATELWPPLLGLALLLYLVDLALRRAPWAHRALRSPAQATPRLNPPADRPVAAESPVRLRAAGS